MSTTVKTKEAVGYRGLASTRPRRRRVGAQVPVGGLSLLGGALLWEAVARIWDVSFFPPLSAALVRLGQMIADGEILRSLGNS